MNASDRLASFKSNLAQTTPFPIGLDIERASGSYIYTTDGTAYLDLISGIAVSSLGHRHPRILQATKDQMDRYMHVMVYGEYVQTPQLELAESLLSQMPKNLQQVYLVNSGAEATEGSLKLAKRYTGRTELISFNKSYHGSTHGALSVSGNETKKYAFRPLLPQVKFLDFNVESELELITENTAAVIVETIQGDAGVRIPSVSYMQQLRAKCSEVGALLILDEIQCGLGRTGVFNAFDHFGIVPDILTLGKALGGGMPIGAFVSSKEIMSSLTHDPMLGHITTFGGHPVICAAANAALKVLLEEKLVQDVERKGALFESLIDHPNIVEIRRKGMFFAIELKNPDAVQQVVLECQEKGVLSFWFLSCPESFRIAPPLNISDEDIRKGAEVIKAAIARL